MRVMPPPPKHSRVDLAELKSQISRRIGMERARSYFAHLNQFLSRKLSKQEFDNLCLIAVGAENIALHNSLVGAILRNACHAKVPPPSARRRLKDGRRPFSEISGCHALPSTSSPPPFLANGDVLPQPKLRRVRSSGRDRRMKDRPSPLGPNGRVDGSQAPADQFLARENGELVHCDLRRPVQVNHATVAESPLADSWQQRPGDVASSQVRDSVDTNAARPQAEAGLFEDPNSIRAALQAPLGIPFCPASVGGSRRPTGGIGPSSCYSCGQLCHTLVLKERMDQIAESQGLGGVTLDSASLLNTGLDSYLKQLVRSCIELSGARSMDVSVRPHAYKQQPQEKVINGMWPGNHVNMQSGSGLPEDPLHPGRDRRISLLDFRVAMELNAQQLGEHWPLLLEKICLRSYEE